MNVGFYKRRRGVVEHIEAGTIDLLEDGIHDYLSLKANLIIGNGYALPAGVCVTSAPALHALCKRVSERTIQRILGHLEQIGWLKTWKTPGKRGNYVVLICRGSVHDLSGNEYRVNGADTTDWRNPVYEPVGEVSGSCPSPVSEVAGNREVRVDKREKKTLAAKPAPPADPRHKLFFDFSYEAFRSKWLQPPTWGAKHGEGLRLFLRRNSHVTLEDWQRHYRSFLASTDAFYQQQKGSLLYFVGNFDRFIDGPILEKGKAYGANRITAEERIRRGDAAAVRFLANNHGVAADVRPAAVPAKSEPQKPN